MLLKINRVLKKFCLNTEFNLNTNCQNNNQNKDEFFK